MEMNANSETFSLSTLEQSGFIFMFLLNLHEYNESDVEMKI